MQPSRLKLKPWITNIKSRKKAQNNPKTVTVLALHLFCGSFHQFHRNNCCKVINLHGDTPTPSGSLKQYKIHKTSTNAIQRNLPGKKKSFLLYLFVL